MCGRYTLTAPDPAALRARFEIEDSVPIRPRFNIAPGDEVLSVTTSRAGESRGELLRWGLVPSWAKHPDGALKMINARVETVEQRPAYRSAFERFRCLIPADGFYEWLAPEGRAKQAFHITRSDLKPFAFAGLWSIWHGPAAMELRSCTILTRPANAAIAPVHDRMPVMLSPEDEGAWIDVATPQQDLHRVLEGLPADELSLRPVGPAVNDARYDGPQCLSAPPPDRQGALF